MSDNVAKQMKGFERKLPSRQLSLAQADTVGHKSGISIGVFDWSSSVTYVLTDWTCLTILYSSGTGNEAM